MDIVDKEVLPRRIRKESVADFTGEHIYWFCDTCSQWRTNEITSSGDIACPVCGAEPDWKKHQPMLSYGSRYKRVVDLCADGAPWRQRYDEVERRYGEFIDNVNAGLPLRTQKAGWQYFHSAWKAVDSLADYLLTARDAPATDSVSVYTENGLQRRYYDSRRSNNIISLSSLNLPHLADDGDVKLTDQEVAEVLSFRKGFMESLYDVYFPNEIFAAIKDPLERSIAIDFSQGAKKRDIERKYRLSERRVRTIVSHIAKLIKSA